MNFAQHIATMQEAVEANDFSEIKNHLHDSFIANQRLDAVAITAARAGFGIARLLF